MAAKIATGDIEEGTTTKDPKAVERGQEGAHLHCSGSGPAMASKRDGSIELVRADVPGAGLP